MDLSLIDDMPAVKAFISQEEIWERFEDGIDKEDFQPLNDSVAQWLLCFDDNKIVGMILVHFDTNSSLMMHPYLLAKYRHKGRDMMSAFYKWFLTLADQVHKLNVSIPITQRKVINFAKKVGFKQEGINRESYMKDGQYYDQIILGLTRPEIEGLI